MSKINTQVHEEDVLTSTAVIEPPPAATRSSESIQADIDRLVVMLDQEHERLAGMESTEGADYRTLLSQGVSDTSGVEKIAKTNAQIAVLQRAIAAAKADFDAAIVAELGQRRQAGADSIRDQLKECESLSSDAQKAVTALGTCLLELNSRHRQIAAQMNSITKDIGISRAGTHLMESRLALTDEATLKTLVLLGLYKLAPFIRPDHTPAGYVADFNIATAKIYAQAQSDIDAALGIWRE